MTPEEISRQLVLVNELNEKQKVFQELSKRIQGNFDIKQYQDIVKRVYEQAEPARKILAEINKHSDYIKNSFAILPTLQHFSQSIKPIQEMIKKPEPVIIVKRGLISAETLPTQQRNAIISRLDNMETLLNKLTTGTKKNIQKNNAQNNKRKIFISEDNGIYLNRNTKKPNYPIKGKKRPEILRSLRGDAKKDAQFLCSLLKYGSISQLSKEIKEINNNFKKKLNLKYDLIIRLQTGGYKFNKEKYDIIFS